MKKNKRKKIWVCMACGKRSNDVYGTNPIDRGWDVACVINSVEVYEDLCVVKDDRVVQINEEKSKKLKGK